MTTKLTFNNIDSSSDGKDIYAPKDIDRLEQISIERNEQRKKEEEEENGQERIKIFMEDDLVLNDVFDLDTPSGSTDLRIDDEIIDL